MQKPDLDDKIACISLCYANHFNSWIIYPPNLGSCTNVTCEGHSICVDDNQGGHTCECPTTCDEMLKDPTFKVSSQSQKQFDDYEMSNEDIAIQFSKENVCATNGISYESECDMRIAACTQQQHLDVVNMGKCGKFF